MKDKIKLACGFMFIFIFFSSIVALAAEFSGDMIHTTREGTVKSKFFVSGNKSRMENPHGIAITRLDKNVMWMLMPAQMMYMEQPLNPDNLATTSEKLPGEIERTFLNQEIIDGRTTNKYRIVYTVGGITATIFQWIAPDLSIPVKTAAVDGSWSMEYKNIRMGSQPDSLFEIPAGYKKFSDEMQYIDETYKGAEEETEEIE